MPIFFHLFMFIKTVLTQTYQHNLQRRGNKDHVTVFLYYLHLFMVTEFALKPTVSHLINSMLFSSAVLNFPILKHKIKLWMYTIVGKYWYSADSSHLLEESIVKLKWQILFISCVYLYWTLFIIWCTFSSISALNVPQCPTWSGHKSDFHRCPENQFPFC